MTHRYRQSRELTIQRMLILEATAKHMAATLRVESATVCFQELLEAARETHLLWMDAAITGLKVSPGNSSKERK